MEPLLVARVGDTVDILEETRRNVDRVARALHANGCSAPRASRARRTIPVEVIDVASPQSVVVQTDRHAAPDDCGARPLDFHGRTRAVELPEKAAAAHAGVAAIQNRFGV